MSISPAANSKLTYNITFTVTSPYGYPCITQALGDGGIGSGCYSVAFSSSVELTLTPVTSADLLLETGRAVASNLINLSLDFCNGDMPGEQHAWWGACAAWT